MRKKIIDGNSVETTTLRSHITHQLPLPLAKPGFIMGSGLPSLAQSLARLCIYAFEDGNDLEQSAVLTRKIEDGKSANLP